MQIMAGKIIIETERCKGCGLCVAVCPNGCIEISTESNNNGFFPPQADCSKCTGCAICAIICPEAIIEVFSDKASRIKIVAGSGSKVKPSLAKEAKYDRKKRNLQRNTQKDFDVRQ